MTEGNSDPLSVDDFEAFYAALYNKTPFAWQMRLVRQVCTESWPSYIKLPTASGKTAAIDIAVFSLAYQAAVANRPDGIISAPRRIFFVVDRRIIVNEAYRRASAIAKRLRNVLDAKTQAIEAPDNQKILAQVASWLRDLANDCTAPPLDCYELRGGIYRNDAWVRSLLQPTVITSTVDQVGSRLLFRGYGVANASLSIHAALTGNDSLIILDEAHCSKPFGQTMAAIEKYRSAKWCTDIVPSPFHFVQMTATPPAGQESNNVLQLTDVDYKNDQILETRHACEKPISLVYLAGVKGTKLLKALSAKLASQAIELHSQKQRKKIAVVVNRVAIARECYTELEKKHPGRVHLMIGRMRPIDRDRLTDFLQSEFGSNSVEKEAASTVEVMPQFVIATQCLEVGADLDFDGMVTQCASLDSLRQRFGRLNRLGETPGACGVIVAAEGDVPAAEKLDPAKPLDPIYGNSLAKTWHWLIELSGTPLEPSNNSPNESKEPKEYVVNFGIKSLDSRVPIGDALAELLAPAVDAPVLMPSHVDMLCQTMPRPTPEPNVADYLHGPNRDCPEVRVCWRADFDLSLIGKHEESWINAVDYCPPSTGECLAVPLHLFRQWLRGEKAIDTSGDVLGELTQDIEQEDHVKDQKGQSVDGARRVLVWRGKGKQGTADSQATFCATGEIADRIRANDTIVIPVEYGGWRLFGHLPDAPDESTAKPIDTYNALMGLNRDASVAHELKRLAAVDIADEAFLITRARTILRAHPKLDLKPELRKLADELQAAAKDENCDFSISRWRARASDLREEYTQEHLGSTDRSAPTIVRLTKCGNVEVKGEICRYPGGVVWITERHKSLTHSEILPLPSFGDDAEELLRIEKVSLIQHLSDVYAEAKRLLAGLGLTGILAETALNAAKFHDLGKADPRFQAMLINKPLSVAYMQPKLWAKSDRANKGSQSNLPVGFRHEMLSMQLFDLFEYSHQSVNQVLLSHLIASHHGYARPFAPACIDEMSEAIDLGCLGAGVIPAKTRKNWPPAHRLDSCVAERFWKLNRKFGWWGVAFLESIVRLSDWQASGFPEQAKELVKLVGARVSTSIAIDCDDNRSTLVLEGLDGSNPLAFLAALGTFRSIALHAPQLNFQLSWAKVQGAWRPVLSSNSNDELSKHSLLNMLDDCLRASDRDHPSLRLATMVDLFGVRKSFRDASASAALGDREDAEWLSCNSSDISDASSISQLQTTRRDYHSINIKGLMDGTSREHLNRSLFSPWDYSDPIAGVSLHLEPREDRRHAYQWYMPSGDPTRSTSGGMIGANRLALEAWPLFQSLPRTDKLVTVGFRGLKANNTRFYWPIWSKRIDRDTLHSLLSLRTLDSTDETDVVGLQSLGIEVVYCCRRILVGKTPNLTAPEPVLS